MPRVNETSLSTYQNFDGSNSTLLLRSEHYKPNEHTALTWGFGASTNFKGTNSFVLEGKAKYTNGPVSFQARSRNSFAEGNSSSQLRLSGEYKVKVSDNVSIYADPYVAAKYKYNTKTLTTDVGAFAGATYKLTDNNAISLEAQKYNGLKGGAENWGVNAVFSHTF